MIIDSRSEENPLSGQLVLSFTIGRIDTSGNRLARLGLRRPVAKSIGRQRSESLSAAT